MAAERLETFLALTMPEAEIEGKLKEFQMIAS